MMLRTYASGVIIPLPNTQTLLMQAKVKDLYEMQTQDTQSGLTMNSSQKSKSEDKKSFKPCKSLLLLAPQTPSAIMFVIYGLELSQVDM